MPKEVFPEFVSVIHWVLQPIGEVPRLFEKGNRLDYTNSGLVRPDFHSTAKISLGLNQAWYSIPLARMDLRVLQGPNPGQ